jgi:LPXTG-motif cell wall-anchored protein
VLPAGEAEAVTILPDTGGASLLAVGAGVLLVVVGGLLAWRVIRS